MMSFSYEQEINQTYADFLGGYLNNFCGNVFSSVKYFFSVIIPPFFIMPSSFTPGPGDLQMLTGLYFSLKIYYFLIFIMIVLTFAYWKRLLPLEKVFVLFSLSSIIFFNIVFNLLFRSFHSNLWRYNLYYLPLFICCLWIFIKASIVYMKPFYSEHPTASKYILLLFLIFIYSPLFISTFIHYLRYEEWAHNMGRGNAQVIEAFLKNEKPKYIYFNGGSHIPYTRYPLKQIYLDATSEQLLKMNNILPEPIEFLILKPTDWLFRVP